MRDVILAAVGEAADASLLPTHESPEPDDMTKQLAQARSAGEAEGICGAAPTNATGSSRSSPATTPRVVRNWLTTSLTILTSLLKQHYWRSRSRPRPRAISTARWRGRHSRSWSRHRSRIQRASRMISAEEVYARRRAAIAAVPQR